MQVLCCAVARVRRKFGIATIASKPTRVTTITISSSVNPDKRNLSLLIAVMLCPLSRLGPVEQRAVVRICAFNLGAVLRTAHKMPAGATADN